MNNRFKIIIFILLIVCLIFIIFQGLFGSSLSYLSVKEIKENRKENKELINSLKINNIDTIYDKNNNVYFYHIPVDYENSNYVLKIDLASGYKYKLLDETLNIVKVNYEKPIDIIIFNDKYYYKTKIQLTNLPLINIKCNEEISSDDVQSEFLYINSSNTEKVINSNSLIHTRGSTSLMFDKKSYKVEMYNKKYTDEKNIVLSNFYYGSSFILDAVYRDPSKIRNGLATEIWNDISKDFTNVDVTYEYVELFINNEYRGLYVLSEPVNRKNLNLNKSDLNNTSIVLKSQGWQVPSIKSDFKNIEDESYLEYELKYPNDNELFSKSWDKILTKLTKYYDSYLDSSYDVINETWNLENYIDLIIFNAFIDNVDNKLYKNNYFYMKDLDSNEIYIQPWDMEYSFGLKYDAKDDKLISKTMEDYNQLNMPFEHQSDEINKLLVSRYWELRKNILTKEYLNKKLDNYKEELGNGAALRDSSIWYEYDIEKEIDEIKLWLENRLEFFDEYVESLENE